MDTKVIFQRLGLPKHAHSVYRVLQKDGQLLATAIARTAGIHRPAVYAALEGLTKNNFVTSVVIGSRKFYKATNPRHIVEEFSKVSEKVATRIARMTPSTTSSVDPNVRLLEGEKGIQEAFDDVISHTPRGETFYRYTSEKDLESVNRYLSKDYRERRDAKKLERLTISNPESGEQKRLRLERFIRYMPSQNNVFDQNVIQTIYGDRVSFIDLNTEKVIIIENKALAEFQKLIFMQLYKKLDH